MLRHNCAIISGHDASLHGTLTMGILTQATSAPHSCHKSIGFHQALAGPTSRPDCPGEGQWFCERLGLCLHAKLEVVSTSPSSSMEPSRSLGPSQNPSSSTPGHPWVNVVLHGHLHVSPGGLESWPLFPVPTA